MITTLNQIRACSPCADGWRKLRAHLGAAAARPGAPLSLAVVIDSNGLDDALWCLQAIKGRDKEIRLFGVWCARQVQHLMTDPRSFTALDVAARFANGDATEAERAAACAAAGAAATEAERAAERAAAGAAAGVAAGAAAGVAARTAAGDAAGAAACAAERAAAGAAAGAAAWAAAWAAARVAQAERLRELCAECAGVTA